MLFQVCKSFIVQNIPRNIISIPFRLRKYTFILIYVLSVNVKRDNNDVRSSLIPPMMMSLLNSIYFVIADSSGGNATAPTEKGSILQVYTYHKRCLKRPSVHQNAFQ